MAPMRFVGASLVACESLECADRSPIVIAGNGRRSFKVASGIPRGSLSREAYGARRLLPRRRKTFRRSTTYHLAATRSTGPSRTLSRLWPWRRVGFCFYEAN